MADFKPTFTKPVSTQSKKVEANFVPVMNQVQQIKTYPMQEEIDGFLGEAEKSLKKKIFDLAKMKTLVFGDPKLSAVYDEMALNGAEKYGYHYNETVLNIIFNDYILNSPKYLQKYKMAIPAKDGRRDKSGINKLKNDGAKKIGKTGTNIVEPDLEKEIEPTVAETDSGSSGAFAPALGYQDKTLNEFGTSGSNGVSATGQYSGPSAWSEKGDLLGNSGKPARKPLIPGGKILNGIDENANYLTDPIGFRLFVEQFDREDADNAVIDKTSAFNSQSIKGWNSKDMNTELNTLRTGKMDSANLETEAVINTSPVQPGQVNSISDLAPILSDIANKLDKIYGQQIYMKKNPTPIREGMDDGNLYDYEVPEWAISALINGDYSGLEPEDETKLNAFVNKVVADLGNANFMLHDIEGKDNLGFRPSNDIDNLGNNVYRLYVSASPNDNENNIKEDTQTMIGDNPESMKNTNLPTGSQFSGLETGMAVNEAKLLAEVENELNAFSIHHDKLKQMTEEKRTSSLVLVDRLGAENKTNFKKDLQHSGTKEIIDVEKELQWKDQQTEIGKDAQKLSQDIEKEGLKLTHGEALKNVGDSANLKGDEIPKRNFTDEEQKQVDLVRLGLGDVVFDNDPGKKYEDRMKADMGDDNYKARQEKLDYRADAPMYNKDTQPTEKGDDKEQYNKYKLHEEMVTGRYYDFQGKSHMIDFKLGEAVLAESVNEAWSSINLSGMGNSYANKLERGSSKLNVNEAVVNTIDAHKYFVDENKIIHAVKNKALMLNENAGDKPVVSEAINKMKHLLGYDASKFTNTEKSKQNRGF